jgi:hypothetical protein
MNEKKDIPSSYFSWTKFFNKSLSDNSQLVFSKKMTVSTINPQDNIPYSEILDIEEIKNLNENSDTALIFYTDNRTIFYNSLKQNSMAHVINYFPLTREKFKMNCLVFALSGDGMHILEPSHKEQFKSYLKINYQYNKESHGKTISLNSDQYSNIADEYIYQFLKEVNTVNKEKILNEHWSRLSNEEKLDYESIDKDSIKCQKEEKLNKLADKDLDKFEAQEEIFYSKNFTVIYMIPLDVEHSIYPMPQVVANSRRPNFESLMKPHKKPKKYFFVLNFSDGRWIFKELNV